MRAERKQSLEARLTGWKKRDRAPAEAAVGGRMLIALGGLLLSVTVAFAADGPATQPLADVPQTPAPVAAAVVSATGAMEASQEPEAAPQTQERHPMREALPEPAPRKYLFPDLGSQALVVDGKRFWFKPIIALVSDYTWFEQDDPSLAQVGRQSDAGELRAGRLGFTFRDKTRLKWDFYFTVDYQEKRPARRLSSRSTT